MIRATRRSVLAGGVAGALALPAAAKLTGLSGNEPGQRALLLHDPALEAGQRFAAAGGQAGGAVLAIEGDRVRLARVALAQSPALVAGVSRHADALLIADVAREAGYEQVAELQGRGAGCTAQHCRGGWQALGRLAHTAGHAWAEALASYVASEARGGAIRSDALTLAVGVSPRPGGGDRGLVLGWVLAPRSAIHRA